MKSKISLLDENERFVLQLGYITIYWATIEHIIDVLVSILFDRFNGRSLYNEIPRSISRKLVFSRDVIKTDSRLSDIAPVTSFFLPKLKSAARFRHLLVHGAPQREHPSDNYFVARDTKYRPEIVLSADVRIQEAELGEFIDRLLIYGSVVEFMLHYCYTASGGRGRIAQLRALRDDLTQPPFPTEDAKEIANLLPSSLP